MWCQRRRFALCQAAMSRTRREPREGAVHGVEAARLLSGAATDDGLYSLSRRSKRPLTGISFRCLRVIRLILIGVSFAHVSRRKGCTVRF